MVKKPAAATLPSTSTTTNNASNKRKPDDIAAVQSQSIQKRQRNTLINDPTAITFLQELGLGQQFLDDGKVLAWGLQPDDPDFLRIHKYEESGQDDKTGVKIQSILRIIPSVHTLAQDPNSFLDFKDDPKTAGMKRMMLWHGTRQDYVKSILENGLRLPTNKAGLFGQGIYFADTVWKSCGYTGCTRIFGYGEFGYLFLSDVLLGNMYKANVTNFMLRKPPPMNVTPWWKIWGQEEFVDCQSVMGVRNSDPFGCSGNVTIDGCTWPLGYGRGSWWSGGFNEYIIYDAKQVKPKFLVKFEWTPKPYYHKIA